MPQVHSYGTRLNEGPRDWQNMFAMTRFRCIEVLFHTFNFTIAGTKNVARYTEDFLI